MLSLLLLAPALSATLLSLEDTSLAPLQRLSDYPGGPATVVRGFQAGPYPGDPESVARAFLEERGPELGLGDRAWQVADTRGWRGRSRVRLVPQVGELPVLGSSVVVQVEPSGHVTWLSSHLPFRMEGNGGEARVSRDKALQVALDQVPGWPVDDDARLALHPTEGVVWDVRVQTQDPNTTWRLRVDAGDGRVLHVADTRSWARGKAYPHNPTNSEVTEVDLLGLPEGATTLEGEWVRSRASSYTSGSNEWVYSAVADENGDFLYEPEEGSFDDPFSSVNAYYQLDTITRWFQEVHGHSFQAVTDVFTNYQMFEGEPYDNGFCGVGVDGGYDITIGQGTIDLAYDGDVLSHEFGHGIIEDLTAVSYHLSYPFGFDELGFHIAPHAMNEGCADYWSSTFHGDPYSAEYFGQALGYSTALRELTNDMTCPESVYGEPHWDGMVVGAATWDIHEAIGKEAADALIYGGLGLAAESPSFQELSEAFLAAADGLVADGALTQDDVAQVQAILDARGLSRCGRSIALQDDVPDQGTWLGADIMEGYVGSSACTLARGLKVVFPLPFQYTFTTPPASEGEMESLTFRVEKTPMDGAPVDEDEDLQYGLYLRRGQPVTFETFNPFALLGIQYTAVTAPLEYDLVVEANPDSVTLTPSDPTFTLEPDTTWYVVLSGMNCPTFSYTFTADLAMVPPPEEDKCGCATGADRKGLLVLLAPLLALLARRRRA